MNEKESARNLGSQCDANSVKKFPLRSGRIPKDPGSAFSQEGKSCKSLKILTFSFSCKKLICHFIGTIKYLQKLLARHSVSG
jgi:hypothetical protein